MYACLHVLMYVSMYVNLCKHVMYDIYVMLIVETGYKPLTTTKHRYAAKHYS
jgi:hypothetical protein